MVVDRRTLVKQREPRSGGSGGSQEAAIEPATSYQNRGPTNFDTLDVIGIAEDFGEE